MATLITVDEMVSDCTEMLRVSCAENDADFDRIINELADLLGMEE
jgi:hypothetical protein